MLTCFFDWPKSKHVRYDLNGDGVEVYSISAIDEMIIDHSGKGNRGVDVTSVVTLSFRVEELGTVTIHLDDCAVQALAQFFASHLGRPTR